METMTSTVPRGGITGSRAEIKSQNKHGEKKNMLLFLKACLELNLALFIISLVSHRRRTILMRDIAFSHAHTHG